MTEMLEKLEALIHERKHNPPPRSHTAALFAAGPNRIAQKFGEEATEVIVAALGEGREAQLGVLGDLFYHTLVLMAQLNISLEDVCAELARRHQPR